VIVSVALFKTEYTSTNCIAFSSYIGDKVNWSILTDGKYFLISFVNFISKALKVFGVIYSNNCALRLAPKVGFNTLSPVLVSI
jgi:hypothetical protein